MRWLLASIRTTAGFLEKSPVDFAPTLTCIIGARGTCKSTLVETIRFAFNCDPTRVAQLLTSSQSGSDESSDGLIGATLGSGTVACVLRAVADDDEVAHTVERAVESQPRVFRDGVQQIDPAEALSQIEIYSQGDLHQIAKDSERRLELIDRPNRARIDALMGRQEQVANQLREVGPRIRDLGAQIEPLTEEVKRLEACNRDLGALREGRPPLPARLEEERELYNRRRATMDRVVAAVSKRAAATEGLEEIAAAGPLLREAGSACRETGGAAGQDLADALLRSEEAIESAAQQLRAARSVDVEPMVEALSAEFERLNEPYYALRREQTAVNESLKREEALRAEVERLERLGTDLERLRRERDRLHQERRTLRAQLDGIAEEIYSLRILEVERINRAHSKFVVLALKQGARSPKYAEIMAGLLRGSNLRGQEEVARDVAERVLPADLVDIVEASDARRLASLLNRDLGQMTRLVGHLVDKPELYGIEGNAVPDELEITMFDGGQAKPIAQLSKGQMATALLPLILRPAPYPLIFDQPEDDLDNRFVFESLVERVRELKSQRQLIFVTHNANIPVLGEAERVVVMSMEGPKAAAPALAGGVEEVKSAIIGLLEGGVEAFNRRQERYGSALTAGAVRR